MKTYKAIASMHFTYDSGLQIIDIDSNYVTVRFVYGGKALKPHKYPIDYKEWEYSNDLEPCFTRKGQTYYISEFMRTDY